MVPTKGGGRHDECDQQHHHHHHHHNHVPPKFLQIKQEDKFFSRLQSKESTSNESSFRVLYYGGAAAGATIPFTWESTPGTPKHPLSDTSFIPPLTPPPSYNQIMKSPASSGLINSHNKPPSLSGKFLQFLSMPRRSSNKEKQKSPSPSSSSFSYSSSFSSSSHSIPSTKNSSTGSRGTNKSSSSESDPVAGGHFWLGDEEEENVNKVDQQITISSPTSTLCFGRGKIGMKKMKSTVLSFVGHATPQKFR